LATIRRPNGRHPFLDWRDPQTGKRQYRSLRGFTKAQQSRALTRLKDELVEPPSTDAPLFEAFSDDYLRWYAVEYPTSYFRIYQLVNAHLVPFFGMKSIADVSGADCREYQIFRMATGIKTETYLKEFRTLKAMLNRAVDWGLLPENPIRHIRGPKVTDSRPPDYYTGEQLQTLYSVATYAAQWQFMANTGLRRGEAIQLDLNKDVGSDELRVISTSDARTKSGKHRIIPLFAGAKEARKRLTGPLLFPNTRTAPSVSRACARDLKRAELDGSIHSLRHTFCSHLAMSGKVSLREIQEWAGHANISTTQKYMHLIPTKKTPAGTLRL